MNKLATSGIAIALAGMMIGCAPRYADVPAPTRFEHSKQDKLQAAEHWRKIAEHFASQLATDLRDKLGGRAIHVPNPGGEQAFVDGFRELLTTALVAQGLPVSTEARNALSVDVRYAIYSFRPDRAQNTYYYGDATALTADGHDGKLDDATKRRIKITRGKAIVKRHVLAPARVRRSLARRFISQPMKRFEILARQSSKPPGLWTTSAR